MMRKEAFAFIIIICLFFPSCMSADHASFTPEKPKIGEAITIAYQCDDSAATLKNAQSISCEALVMMKESSPEIIEVQLTKTDGSWKGSLQLANEKSSYLIFRFAAGDLIDNNKNAYWEVLIRGKDEKPIEGALHARAQSLIYPFGTFAKERNPENAKKDIKEELRLYPNNIGAVVAEWTIMIMENNSVDTYDTIKKRLQQVFDSHNADETAAVKLLPWFDRTGQKEKADGLRAEWVKKNPKGLIAKSVRETEIGTAKDLKQRVELIEKYLGDFSLEPQQLQNFQSILVSAYLRAIMFDKALAFVEKIKNPDPKILNSLAWALIEKGEHLDKAVDLARNAVDAARVPSHSMKPFNRSMREWQKGRSEQLAMILDTFGYGLFKTGKTVDAQEAYEESYALNQDVDVDGILRIIDCYRANGVYQKAIEMAEKAIVQRKSDDLLIAKFKST
jgi:tetratricopeptide (TPR) repeat protein